MPANASQGQKVFEVQNFAQNTTLYLMTIDTVTPLRTPLANPLVRTAHALSNAVLILTSGEVTDHLTH